MKNKLRKAILAEEITICQKLMEVGYYPYGIAFRGNGNIEITCRESVNDDQKLLDKMVKDLSSIGA